MGQTKAQREASLRAVIREEIAAARKEKPQGGNGDFVQFIPPLKKERVEFIKRLFQARVGDTVEVPGWEEGAFTVEETEKFGRKVGKISMEIPMNFVVIPPDGDRDAEVHLELPDWVRVGFDPELVKFRPREGAPDGISATGYSRKYVPRK